MGDDDVLIEARKYIDEKGDSLSAYEQVYKVMIEKFGKRVARRYKKGIKALFKEKKVRDVVVLSILRFIIYIHIHTQPFTHEYNERMKKRKRDEERNGKKDGQKKKKKMREEKAVSVPVIPPTTTTTNGITTTKKVKKTKPNKVNREKNKAILPKDALWAFKSRSTGRFAPRHGRLWDLRRDENLRQGTYSAQEKETLMNAIKDYAKEHNITDLEDLTNRNRTFRGAWSTIATALPHRSVRSVYNYGQRVLHIGRKTGRFTPDEVQTMLDLYAKHGRNWKMIGKIMNRDPNQIRNKHTKYLEKGSTKEWTKEEDELLTKLVLEHHKDLRVLRNERVWPLFNIQWHEIRNHMTIVKRTRDSLKRRWQNIVKKNLAPNPFSIHDDIALARFIKALDPKTVKDIKWSEAKFGDLTHSGWQIKDRWMVLSRKIKGHETMSMKTLTNKVLQSALFRFESSKSNGHDI